MSWPIWNIRRESVENLQSSIKASCSAIKPSQLEGLQRGASRTGTKFIEGAGCSIVFPFCEHAVDTLNDCAPVARLNTGRRCHAKPDHTDESQRGIRYIPNARTFADSQNGEHLWRLPGDL